MSDAIYSERLEAVQVSRLDLIAFFGAVVGGLGNYFVFRVLGINQLYTTVFLIAVMFIYTLVVTNIPRVRVRLDQAGDNAYYLGLLFTLSSMAFALYDFTAAESATPMGGANHSGASQIIGNFGI